MLAVDQYLQVFTKPNATQFRTYRDVTDQATVWVLTGGLSD